MGRVIHFEIPAGDTERAIGFYRQTFNWSFHKWDGPVPYWMVATGGKDQPGIDGAIMPRQHPGQSVNNVVQVESVDDAIAAVKKHGGTVLTPKIPIPGIGYYANCQDTEGNPFGVMQPDPSASA